MEELKKMGTPQIALLYVLGLQKVMSYLFTLRAYARESKSGVKEDDLKASWAEFESLSAENTLNGDGSISDKTAEQINRLREDLESKVRSAEDKLHDQPFANSTLPGN